MYVKGRLVQWKGRVLILVWCSAIPRSSNDTYERQLCLGNIRTTLNQLAFIEICLLDYFLKGSESGSILEWNITKTSVECFLVSVNIGRM